MGKKQHQSNRPYLSATEWKALGGYKDSASDPAEQRLPFDHCALTFTPWTTPVCDRDGNIFDLMHIIPYLQQHHKNPITSAPLHLRDLIRLHFHSDPATPTQYACPVSHKPFSPLHSHIVAIATTGHVYAAAVVDELCVKAGVLEDLLSGERFGKEDIITLQDPHNLKTRIVRSLEEHSAEQKSQPAASQPIKQTSPSPVTKSVVTASSSPSSSSSSASAPDPFVARGLHSSHHATGSFTSTSLTPVTANTRTALTDADKRQQQYKAIRSQKTTAYARLITSHGHINLALHASQTPHTVHNFLTLATRGYYNGTRCHRLIAGFMAQFGDPTGTGRGGAGAFERTFGDELVAGLRHDRRGVLSMANSGPGTNGSQFFITFAACAHLDSKHTVFGEVVGGTQALDAIERAGDRGDSDDSKRDASKPRKAEAVTIERVEVYQNPFKDDWVATDAVTGQREDAAQQRAAEETKRREDGERKAWFSRPIVVDRDVEQKEIGHLIKAAGEGEGDGVGGGRKRKDGPVMPAPVNDEDEAIRQLKKRQAISRAMAAPRPGTSQLDFSNW